jgi:hypothetical protein
MNRAVVVAQPLKGVMLLLEVTAGMVVLEIHLLTVDHL